MTDTAIQPRCVRCGSTKVRADVIPVFDPNGAVVGVRLCDACYTESQ